MATRIAARYVSRRLSSSGKVFSEEEKAAENIYIKKTEQEKLEKLARQGPISEEKSTGSGGSTADANPSSSASSISSDKKGNFALIAGGVVVAAGALGWYLRSSSKKSEVKN